MTRMGHDDPRAALVYQHRSDEADQAIARAVNEQLEREQAERDRRAADKASGPADLADEEPRLDEKARVGC
jgi:hypothetical protein